MRRYYFKLPIIFMSLLMPLNLELHSSDNPSASHFLDGEISGNTLIVTGTVGGTEFYDITDRENLVHLDNFSISGGGGGGGNAKGIAVISHGNYAYFSTTKGLATVNISNPSNPQTIGFSSGTSGLNLENLDISNSLLAVCAHTDGVRFYSLSNPSSPTLISTISTDNAWTVKIINNYAYVGDNSSLLVINIEDIESPYIENSITLGSAIKDIASDGQVIYVANGSDGISAFSLHNPSYPELIDSYNTPGLANRIHIFNGYLAVSDWESILVFEIDGGVFSLVGYKSNGKRAMAINADGNYIYSIEWGSVQVYEYKEISGPDIDLSELELNYPYVENGDTFSMSIDVTNNGKENLVIYDNYTTNSEFIVSNPLNDLGPGETQTVEIIYSSQSNNASGSYRIYSNDSDEYEVICETNGNINGANIGQHAPDFNLQVIANGSGNYSLSDQIGNIVVLAFFAPN
ncbi:MAG: hypothetical protein CBD58_02265 [bacterium TMED198]|nr:MAG: hypothetical protein CBD58_02265 [bacterium TMED198]|tara:strand:+ start:2924 stop:4306 length:1383 start_codon:yes stop_codon:yes gene_type:complete